MAAACGWPVAEWAVPLLPLLAGEAQVAALLPAAGQDIKKAVLDRMGYSGEEHLRRFRTTKLAPADHHFVFA